MTSSPAPRQRARFCETCRRKWRVRVRVRRCAQHGGFRPLLNLPLFLRVLLKILHRIPLGLMDSATSDFRPLTLSFRFEPFVSSSERNGFPPLSETFCFSSDCNVLLSDLSFAYSDFSIPWSLFVSGGGGSCRGQGKSAAPWPAWRATR